MPVRPGPSVSQGLHLPARQWVGPEVFCVIGDLDVGGTERHLAQVLPELVARGVRPVVYTLTHRGVLAPVLESAGVQVIAPPAADRIRLLPRWLRAGVILPLTTLCLAYQLVRRRPSVAHFYLPAAYLLGGFCSLAAGVPVRVMSRRSLNRYQARHRVLAGLERWLHRRMTAVLGNSQAVVRDLLTEGVSPERVGLLHNGIDLRPFAGPARRDSLRAQFGVSEETLLIICVANLIPYKGHRDLFQALAGIRASLGVDWRLLCVGEGGEYRHVLEAEAKRLGIEAHVHFLGSRSDVPALLMASDVGVLASHEEGFSNSILEGMAAGLPMVVTAVGGNGEAVEDGETGRVVPPQDLHALGLALAELAVDPELRKRFGSAGRARVAQRYSLEVCVARYAGLYEGLLTQPATPVTSLLPHPEASEAVSEPGLRLGSGTGREPPFPGQSVPASVRVAGSE